MSDYSDIEATHGVDKVYFCLKLDLWNAGMNE